jgi:hypothetical protein
MRPGPLARTHVRHDLTPALGQRQPGLSVSDNLMPRRLPFDNLQLAYDLGRLTTIQIATASPSAPESGLQNRPRTRR